jgi:molybdopterin-guanine dinucleotide biosynthesis protein A
MGRDKALLPFGGTDTLLGRVARRVIEVVPPDRVVCVAAEDQPLPLLPDGIQTARDPEPRRGPLAGLVNGIVAIKNRADVVFACGCDMPLLEPAFVKRMFDVVGDHQIAAPYDDERWHPLAAVYRTEVLPAALSLLEAGERSLVSLLDRCDTLRVSVDVLKDADAELKSLATCNTPAEYQQALARAFPRTIEP